MNQRNRSPIFGRTVKRVILQCSLVVFLWHANLAMAQSTSYDLVRVDSTAPSVDELVRALTPTDEPDAALRAISLKIRIEPESHQLADDTQHTLANLAAAMVSPALSNCRFRIEAHTDGLGSADYNRALSEYRARGLVDYLVHRHSVALERLEPAAVGSDSLLRPEQPGSARNRVVLIVNLGADSAL